MQDDALTPELARLEPLVGEWEMQVVVDGQAMVIGRTRFEWLEGGGFLIQHSEGEVSEDMPADWVSNSPMPLTTIIGLDDSSGTFSVLYADARRVCRVYEMTLDDGVWTQRREAPGFNQRFTGSFSDDGTTITARWETSTDGETWEPDFDMVYTKVS